MLNSQPATRSYESLSRTRGMDAVDGMDRVHDIPCDARAAGKVPDVSEKTDGTGRATQNVLVNIVPGIARQWVWLAVSSLVLAGLLSLSVVIGRLPWISPLIADPLFFKRCLVVHVDLALLVWFYAFIAALSALRIPWRGKPWGGRLIVAPILAGVGVVALVGGALASGAEPVLANYIPVIDHPLFLGGLACFFVGIIIYFIHNLTVPTVVRAGGLPEDASHGAQAAGVAILLAGTTYLSAWSGMPAGVDSWTFFEFTAWGAGHVLQVANVCGMLAVWLWMLKRATGKQVFRPQISRICFLLLVLPHFAMPLLSWRGSLNVMYINGATDLMRWGIFPIMLFVLGVCVRHLWKHPVTDGAGEALRWGFFASAALAVLGVILGAMIRESSTLIPAHYHASLGAVTAAFMAGVFLLIEASGKKQIEKPAGKSSENIEEPFARLWKSVKRQLIIFGTGQTIFVLGFAIGGIYGLGRKAYGSEQHIRGVEEMIGLIVMGVGGLIAVVGGLWFLFLVLREMFSWLHRQSEKNGSEGRKETSLFFQPQIENNHNENRT